MKGGYIMGKGLPGKLKPKNFGFAMPVTMPPFDPPPYYYRDIELLGFAYETEDEAAAAIVPEGLTLADSPAVAQLLFPNFHFSTLGAYKEVIIGINCLWEKQPVTYTAGLLVTNEVGLIGGREPYGFPKIFANIEWSKERNLICAWAERPTGKRICTGVLRPRDNLQPTETNPLVTLKVIPSPEEGAPPEVCELVLVHVKFELIVGSDGRGEGFSGPGNVTYDSPSVVDSYFRLPVKRDLGGSWGRYNFVLPCGKVIKRYKPTKPAITDAEGNLQPAE
jgi:acetoacetate decarboxylase